MLKVMVQNAVFLSQFVICPLNFFFLINDRSICVGAWGRQLSHGYTTWTVDAYLTGTLPAVILSKILVFPFAIQKYEHKIIQKYSFNCYSCMGVKLGLSH